jgi:Putative esterase
VATGDGGLSIASQQAVGSASGYAGDIRVAETYGSDQSSQVEVTSTQLSGGEWMGPAVRMQDGGQDLYLGIYYWNAGDPQLRLYKRSDGTFVQLGSSYECGALPAGTQLKLSVVGSTLSFQENGTERIAATDTTLTGGAPGLMTFGAATADNWVGNSSSAPTRISVQYVTTDADGVASYDFTSPDDGPGTQVLRVLAPTNPAPGVPHNFLYVLPVEPGLGATYGDGLETLRSLDAQDKYNLTIIEPSFAVDPWYADSATDADYQYETFITQDLVPWVTQNLSTSGSSGAGQPFGTVSGHEQNWLIGFSKSGLGAADLLFKHPDLFSVAASWDFPADMSSYDQFGTSSSEEYGTDANFQANYRLTQSFVDSHKAPFLSQNRIWIGGYQDFQSDMADYDALLTSEGIQHTTETPTPMAHTWDSGWVPIALSALSQDSAALAAAP